MSLGQLGMTPDNPCYDPNRSSWLPYFINDGKEQACIQGAKAGASAVTGFTQGEGTLKLGTAAQQNALTPGLPAGYDPVTGLINPLNTEAVAVVRGQYDPITGAAPVESTYAQTVVADNPVTLDPSDPNAPWYCQYFSIGCGTGPGISTMTIVIAVAAIALAVGFVGGKR